MLDIYARAAAGRHSPIIRSAEFFRIELAPLLNGRIGVSLTATTVDDKEPELLDQEIARDHIETIDELVALIRTHVSIAPEPAERASALTWVRRWRWPGSEISTGSPTAPAKGPMCGRRRATTAARTAVLGTCRRTEAKMLRRTAMTKAVPGRFESVGFPRAYR